MTHFQWLASTRPSNSPQGTTRPSNSPEGVTRLKNHSKYYWAKKQFSRHDNHFPRFLLMNPESKKESNEGLHDEEGEAQGVWILTTQYRGATSTGRDGSLTTGACTNVGQAGMAGSDWTGGSVGFLVIGWYFCIVLLESKIQFSLHFLCIQQ